MKPIDLTTVLKDAPIGDWIALSYARDRIVATAPTLKAAVQAAKDLGESQPIMMKVSPYPLAPSVWFKTEQPMRLSDWVAPISGRHQTKKS